MRVLQRSAVRGIVYIFFAGPLRKRRGAEERTKRRVAQNPEREIDEINISSLGSLRGKISFMALP